MPKIVYFVQNYNPHNEAISKEVAALKNNFSSIIVNIRGNLKIKRYLFSFNYKKQPFLVPLIPILSYFCGISHIYTSFGNYFFLKLLRKKPIIITAAGPTTKSKIRKCRHLYTKIDKFIVQSKKDGSDIIKMGVNKTKVKLIFPGIDLNKFTYIESTEEKFTLLLASSPLMKSHIIKKGVKFLIDSLPDDVNLIILMRNKFIKEIKALVKEKKNIKLINEPITDINKIFGLAHATVYFPLYKEVAKSCPFSVMESLAAGKPVLVSDVVGISDLIKTEDCGIVASKSKRSFIKALYNLRHNYFNLQKNCRKTAEKYFSIEEFIKKHYELYSNYEVFKK